jgi:hypothetical protein
MTEMIKTWRANHSLGAVGRASSDIPRRPAILSRAFSKLDETLATAGPDNITIKIRLQSQPPHVFRCDRPLRIGRFHCQLAETAKTCSRQLPPIEKSSNSPNIAAAQTWMPRQNKSLRALRSTVD